MLVFPRTEHEVLANFVEAIRKRSRALKTKFGTVECERVVEIKDGVERERIDLRLWARARNGVRLSCWLWDDRWCWFDARRRAKQGGEFTWFYDGRIAPGKTGTELVSALERAHECVWGERPNEPALEAIWSPLLLRGPR
jgi:hypothetical protein